jgi:hypothetical protein
MFGVQRVGMATTRRLGRRSIRRAEIERWGDAVGDGITALRSDQSLWLIDRLANRYQRCSLDCDPGRSAQFGEWRELSDISIETTGELRVIPAEPQVLPIRATLTRSPAAAL